MKFVTLHAFAIAAAKSGILESPPFLFSGSAAARAGWVGDRNVAAPCPHRVRRNRRAARRHGVRSRNQLRRGTQVREGGTAPSTALRAPASPTLGTEEAEGTEAAGTWASKGVGGRASRLRSPDSAGRFLLAADRFRTSAHTRRRARVIPRAVRAPRCARDPSPGFDPRGARS